ncbi:MAG: 1-deoxy-D-xylulose-5-phosphate synthase [Elusimicrobia bacterium]|nr:1-deoxy-D-xylulose-5-phosphate synthase [Elusimicrobiota bacterium]
MRDAFANEITLLGKDPRVVLLSGDIGNRMFDKYKAQFPDRFYNCGVAEANMIGLGAGLAMSGLRPVAYTINSFITARCYEQIRVDLCYHKVPMVLVGVGAGLCYASLGATHHSCEDIAMMRVLPEMTVLAPGDAWEVRGAIRAALKHNGPVFIRIGKKGEPVVHTAVPDFVIGKAIRVRTGSDVCILSTGNVLPLAMDVSDALGKESISTQVVSFHTIKPLDQSCLSEVFKSFKLVVTLEEHSVLGGVGGAVAEWISDQPRFQAKFHRFGTSDVFLHEAGEQEHAREVFGLTVLGLKNQMVGILTGKGNT